VGIAGIKKLYLPLPLTLKRWTAMGSPRHNYDIHQLVFRILRAMIS
jgi:hypothetical protein